LPRGKRGVTILWKGGRKGGKGPLHFADEKRKGAMLFLECPRRGKKRRERAFGTPGKK